MKIGIDCRFWGIQHAGLGRYIRELVLALVKQNSESRIQNPERSIQFTLFFQKGEWEQDKALLKNCKIVEVTIPHYSLKEQLLFWKVIDKEKLDLMHFTHFNIPVLTQTPYIVTIHDLIKHFFKGRPVTTRNEMIYWLKYGGYRFTINQAIKRAQHIIVPSYFVKDQIGVEYPGMEGKISVVYEGVAAPYGANSKFEIRNPKQAERILTKYKLKSPFFIYTGSAYPSKDIPTLLQAIKQLISVQTQDFASLHLLIACARNHFWQKLANEVKKLNLENTVILPGQVPDEDLQALYKKAVAFVTPSLMEGFGLPGLEAMAAGCPVIASDAGSLPEIYEKGAIYFQSGNPEALAEKMEYLINLSNTERSALIDQGWHRATQFSWEKAAVETIGVYAQILYTLSS